MRSRLRSALFLVCACAALSCCTKASAPEPTNQPQAASPQGNEDLSKRASVKIWRTLVELSPRKPPPSTVSMIVGKAQTVAGFMIPNDAGSMDDVREFLLTPVSGGCAHVPPPPPNYVIHVRLRNGATRISWGVVETTGYLSLAKEKDRGMYGYELLADEVRELSQY